MDTEKLIDADQNWTQKFSFWNSLKSDCIVVGSPAFTEKKTTLNDEHNNEFKKKIDQATSITINVEDEKPKKVSRLKAVFKKDKCFVITQIISMILSSFVLVCLVGLLVMDLMKKI